MRVLFTLFLTMTVALVTSNVHPAVTYDSASDTPPGKEISVEAKDGTEIVVSHYPATGDTLILWVGSSYGISDRMRKVSHALADRGLEIWQVEFAEVLFEPNSSNFMRNLDAQYVADLIVEAHKKTNKKIILHTRAYGAIPVVRGATLWQLQNPGKDYLSGAILNSPDFFVSIPELGVDPDYLPITSQTTIPMFIFQGGRRGTAWQFPKLLELLTKTNQHVFFKLMPGVSGVYYSNDDADETIQILKSFPDIFPGVVRLLNQTRGVQAPPTYIQPTTVHNARMDIELKPFRGNRTPSAFTLKDVNKKSISLGNVSGKVTVVNFWATWCPPCVEEIPSLNRLKDKMKNKPFRLISINYMESEQLVSDFLKRVNVEFPVLLDRDGSVSAIWNVIAFPSTFVIGPDGKIHYGINAAISWDSPEVINKLDALIKK